MRKLAVAGLAGLLAAALATAALAQTTGSWPSVNVKPTVSPNKAGTPSHPQGVKLKVAFHWQTLGSSNQPIVTKFFLLFPKGSKYNGGSVTKCSLGTLNARGPTACPKASILGSGTGDAYADTVITHPQITVVNGGASKVYFYTVLNNPARVQQPVIGNITKRGGKYSYALSVSVPQDLQIVAGVPIELTSLSVTAGRGSWLETTGCSHGKWPFSVTTSYLDPNSGATGSSSFSDTLKCRS